MGVFFNEDYTQADAKAMNKSIIRHNAKKAVHSGAIPKENVKSIKHAAYKRAMESDKHFFTTEKGRNTLGRLDKAVTAKANHNRAKFFAHEDYSEDQAHDHKFGFDDSEGLYNADDYGHDEDDFAIDPGHSEKNDVYKDNAAAKLPGVLAASTAGGVTADDAADLQEGYGNDSLRAEFRDRIGALEKRQDRKDAAYRKNLKAKKENEYSRDKYFVDKMRKQAERNIRAKLFSKNN